MSARAAGTWAALKEVAELAKAATEPVSVPAASPAQVPALGGSGAARILVAGIGHAARGDYAFGKEIIRESLQRQWPDGVRLVDFGIRRYDLAFALAAGFDAVILVDAAPRGQEPGTLYLVEVEQEQVALARTRPSRSQALDPIVAIRLANAIGQSTSRIYIVACEPAVLKPQEGQMGLSGVVEAAVLPAVDLIQSVVQQLLRGRGV
ncbi:MAG TPA: hydrogenase maturation protease [Verrucomicrobiae bacterium]|nr:hydrogenase maturation protease [Verrucomicrobiae bacterium]